MIFRFSFCFHTDPLWTIQYSSYHSLEVNDDLSSLCLDCSVAVINRGHINNIQNCLKNTVPY